MSEEFKLYLSNNGIEHVTSPPLWPQANGEVEAQNKTLLKAIRVAQDEGKVWQEELHKFCWLIAEYLRKVQVPHQPL